MFGTFWVDGLHLVYSLGCCSIAYFCWWGGLLCALACGFVGWCFIRFCCGVTRWAAVGAFDLIVVFV